MMKTSCVFFFLCHLPLSNLGVRSIYLPSEVQKDAHGSTGLPLDFYLSYNVSVHNPASYFDQVPVACPA